jgi:hypothetical protein
MMAESDFPMCCGMFQPEGKRVAPACLLCD